MLIVNMNSSLCQRYIDSQPESARAGIQFVIDNTEYFTKQQIVDECRRLIEK